METGIELGLEQHVDHVHGAGLARSAGRRRPRAAGEPGHATPSAFPAANRRPERLRTQAASYSERSGAVHLGLAGRTAQHAATGRAHSCPRALQDLFSSAGDVLELSRAAAHGACAAFDSISGLHPAPIAPIQLASLIVAFAGHVHCLRGGGGLRPQAGRRHGLASAERRAVPAHRPRLRAVRPRSGLRLEGAWARSQAGRAQWT